MSTRNLIDAIEAGEASNIEASFNDIMANKVSERIDSMRDVMAQNMFTDPEMKSEEELTDEELADEELALEGYSLEELEEFMMSEEFEQLDELSKTTLGNYVKTAKGSLIGGAQVMGMGNKMTGQKTQDKAETQVRKRASGINKAVDRLTK
jgi:hypothetical protein